MRTVLRINNKMKMLKMNQNPMKIMEINKKIRVKRKFGFNIKLLALP